VFTARYGLNVYGIYFSPVVTIHTTRFNIHKLYILPTQCIYVFCVDLRTNRLFPYTVITDLFL